MEIEINVRVTCFIPIQSVILNKRIMITYDYFIC